MAGFVSTCDIWMCLMETGLMNSGESVESAALRELQEETGFVAEVTSVSPGMWKKQCFSCFNGKELVDELVSWLSLVLTGVANKCHLAGVANNCHLLTEANFVILCLGRK